LPGEDAEDQHGWEVHIIGVLVLTNVVIHIIAYFLDHDALPWMGGLVDDRRWEVLVMGMGGTYKGSAMGEIGGQVVAGWITRSL